MMPVASRKQINTYLFNNKEIPKAISTIPVAIIPLEEIWFVKLQVGRKGINLSIPKPIQNRANSICSTFVNVEFIRYLFL